MFGKIMSLNDELIIKYLKVCTKVPEEEINNIENKIKSEELNPRDAKIQLAKEIIKTYHTVDDAEKAEENFKKTFVKGDVPENVLEVKVEKRKRLDEVLLEQKTIDSKNEWRRLINQNGITIIESGEKVSDLNFVINETQTFRVGKKRFIKIII
jgi:tyrosyl-tRNA synthetase